MQKWSNPLRMLHFCMYSYFFISFIMFYYALLYFFISALPDFLQEQEKLLLGGQWPEPWK